MNKPLVFLSLSLLLSLPAYGVKIGPKLENEKIESEKEVLVNQPEKTKQEEKAPSQESEKQESSSWGFFDSIQHATKNLPDKIIIALKQNKLNLKDKTGADYIWVEKAILYCRQYPQYLPQLITIYSILKQKDALPNDPLNKNTREFLEKQLMLKKATLEANSLNFVNQVCTESKSLSNMLNSFANKLNTDIGDTLELDKSIDLTFPKGQERTEENKLNKNKIDKELGVQEFMGEVKNFISETSD